MPAGRPSTYSTEIANQICERISEGESLRAITRDDGMPAMAVVCRWLAAHPEFSDQYTRAREIQADTLADEILQISDDGLNDTYLDEDGNKRTDHDVVARSRLRVDARKWYASKVAPKKYGDKVVHAGDPDEPIAVTVDVGNAISLLDKIKGEVGK